MNQANVQDTAAASIALILLALLLVPCRVWCRRVAKKIAIGTYRRSSAFTARILREMAWRVALMTFAICLLAVLCGDANTRPGLIAAAMVCYPVVLLSLWQVARRISKAAVEASVVGQSGEFRSQTLEIARSLDGKQHKAPPSQEFQITAAAVDVAMSARRYRLTIVEGFVGVWLGLTAISFLTVVVPERHKPALTASASATGAVRSIPRSPTHIPISSHGTASPARLLAPEALSRTVYGEHLGYTLEVPSVWETKKRVAQGLDSLLASYDALNVTVLAEQGKVGTSEQTAAAVRARLNESATEIDFTDPELITLAGKNWLGFVVKCRVDQMLLGYQYYVYSGPEGTYQVVGWTFQSRFERDADTLRTVMRTFHFPSRTDERQMENKAAEPLVGNQILSALRQSAVAGIDVLRFNMDATMSRSQADGERKKTLLIIEGKDSSEQPGSRINLFKRAVATNHDLQTLVGKITSVQVTSFSPPATAADGTAYVLFTIECQCPSP
jgi:hypothetical protein